IHPTCVLGARVTVGAESSLGPYVVVGNDVTLGERVQVHAHAVIEDDVQIGPDSILHAQVTVRRGCRLGARVVVQSGAVIGSDGFGYAQDAERRHIHIPQIGRVVLEDDVEIGANATVDRAMLGVTRIGRGTKLDNLVHIAHNVQIGEDVAIAAAVFVAGSARIGNRVLIGGWVGIRDHAVIGDDAIVHADTGVSQDVAPGDVVAGHPAWPAKSQRRAEAAYRRPPELVRGLRGLTRRLRRPEGASRSAARMASRPWSTSSPPRGLSGSTTSTWNLTAARSPGWTGAPCPSSVRSARRGGAPRRRRGRCFPLAGRSGWARAAPSRWPSRPRGLARPTW